MKKLLLFAPVVALLASGLSLHAQLPAAPVKKQKKEVVTQAPAVVEEDVLIDTRSFIAATPAAPGAPGAPQPPPPLAPGVNPDQVARQIEGAIRAAVNATGENVGELKDHLQIIMADQLNAAAQGLAAPGVQRRSIRSFNGRPGGPGGEPVIITSTAMENSVRAELKEDLKVMQKVLQDGLREADRDNDMAVRVMMVDFNSLPPMYVRGHGAIFPLNVDFPLVSGGRKADKKPGGRKPQTAWERAQTEVRASTNADGNSRVFVQTFSSGDGPSRAVPPFDAARVERLKEQLIDAMAEASNIRNLGPQESLTVTVSGTDEGGRPVRLTLELKKSDLDAAAGGKLSAEELRKKVAHTLG